MLFYNKYHSAQTIVFVGFNSWNCVSVLKLKSLFCSAVCPNESCLVECCQIIHRSVIQLILIYNNVEGGRKKQPVKDDRCIKGIIKINSHDYITCYCFYAHQNLLYIRITNMINWMLPGDNTICLHSFYTKFIEISHVNQRLFQSIFISNKLKQL